MWYDGFPLYSPTTSSSTASEFVGEYFAKTVSAELAWRPLTCTTPWIRDMDNAAYNSRAMRAAAAASCACHAAFVFTRL